MGIYEIASAVMLILSCVFIIIIVLMQESKRGMSQSITGSSSDNYYQKNMGRTKEIKLKRLTTAAAVVFFVVAMAVSIVGVHFSGGGTANSGSDVDFDWSGLTDGEDDDIEDVYNEENGGEEDGGVSE
ncbi:MAG: preprotein translocase subunit SecG [Oscillospiraceae bacterium]|jgi:preprotein translocase subunit SecG|nr:preprotein translocase subunit SecG [Oscillospiraceae bacterium]